MWQSIIDIKTVLIKVNVCNYKKKWRIASNEFFFSLLFCITLFIYHKIRFLLSLYIFPKCRTYCIKQKYKYSCLSNLKLFEHCYDMNEKHGTWLTWCCLTYPSLLEDLWGSPQVFSMWVYVYVTWHLP